MTSLFVFIAEEWKIHTLFEGTDAEFRTFMEQDEIMRTAGEGLDEGQIEQKIDTFLQNGRPIQIEVGDPYIILKVYKTTDETRINPQEGDEEEFEELPPEEEQEDVARGPAESAEEPSENPKIPGGKKKKKARKYTQRKKKNGPSKVRRHKTRRVF